MVLQLAGDFFFVSGLFDAEFLVKLFPCFSALDILRMNDTFLALNGDMERILNEMPNTVKTFLYDYRFLNLFLFFILASIALKLQLLDLQKINMHFAVTVKNFLIDNLKY